MAHDEDDSLAPALEELSTDDLTVTFEAERFKGAALSETMATIAGNITVDWEQREEFVRALQEVIEKYKIWS